MKVKLEGHYGYGRLIVSAVPLIAMMVLISLYSIVDGLFVSNLVGTTAFAALNLIWPALGLVGALELLAGPVARLFVGYDPDLTALTVRATRLYAPDFLLAGIPLFISAWFTGLGNGPVSALVSFSRTFLFELGCVLLLPALFGAEAIWFSAFVAEIFALVLGGCLLLRLRKRYGYSG